MNGKVKIPPRNVWGAFWIEKQYRDEPPFDEEWMRPKNVTWDGPQVDASRYRIPKIDNEWRVAWKFGRLIDGVRECKDAIEWAVSTFITMYWATKAENT